MKRRNNLLRLLLPFSFRTIEPVCALDAHRGSNHTTSD
jgi:hypothetical protein